MGIFDKAKELADKAEELASEHADQIEGGVDKAAGLIEGKVGHADQIDKVADAIKEHIPDKQ
jgi:hypothetical protein